MREREEKMFLLVGMERKYDFLYICLELCSLLTVLLVFDFLDGFRKYYIPKYELPDNATNVHSYRYLSHFRDLTIVASLFAKKMTLFIFP